MLNRPDAADRWNEPKLAELFAHAELRRSDCTAASVPALSADWLTGAEQPAAARPRSDTGPADCAFVTAAIVATSGQDTGFHENFSLFAAFCEPVWRN